ncbi:kelch-like protein 7 [Drosophila madeirensis]|uniref:Kelch-like protein 7 n=1 Tax=Drosophila madeirensis TaxID=30013 RepID=A0AAU9FA52_DROMD
MNEDNELSEESVQEREPNDSTPIPAFSLRNMGYREPKEGIDQKLCSRNEYKEHIIRGMDRIISQQQKTDIAVYVRGHKFLCHLCVLKTCTEFAKNLHFPNSLIIAHEDVTPTGFQLAYEWMIHKDSTLKRKDIVELYLAAEYMNVPELLDHVWHLFNEKKLVNDAMAFQIYLECLPHRRNMLQDLMLRRVHRFFLMAVTTEEYLQLDLKNVSEILSHSNMCVNSELEIYYSAVRWLHHDWPQRKTHAPRIMGVVHFHLLPHQCINLIREELPELHNIPEVQRLINDALAREKTRRAASLRQWVYDRQIPHHHSSVCPKWRCLDLAGFDQYLELIIATGPNYSQSLRCLRRGYTMPCCRSALLRKS